MHVTHLLKNVIFSKYNKIFWMPLKFCENYKKNAGGGRHFFLKVLAGKELRGNIAHATLKRMQL